MQFPRKGVQGMQNRGARRSGFSLLELLIVMVVMMVVTVASFPTISKTMQGIRLQSSTQNLASLLQRTRILAVRANGFYSIVFTATSSGGQEACIDVDFSSGCSSGDPTIALASNVSLVTNGTGPSTAQITCGSVSTTCPTGFTGLNYVPEAANVPPSYNARGLPCVGNPATTQPTPTGSTGTNVCNEWDTSGASPQPVGFVFKLQYSGTNSTTYSAIAVTPSGLVTTWTYNGSSWTQQ